MSSLTIACCKHLLLQTQKIHTFSVGISVAAAVGVFLLIHQPHVSLVFAECLFGIVILGAIETFFSCRVGFDAGLLGELQDSKLPMQKCKDMDRALHELGFVGDSALTTTRDIPDRLNGCLTLLKRQTLCVILQIIALLLSLLIYLVL